MLPARQAALGRCARSASQLTLPLEASASRLLSCYGQELVRTPLPAEIASDVQSPWSKFCMSVRLVLPHWTGNMSKCRAAMHDGCQLLLPCSLGLHTDGMVGEAPHHRL